jgi:3,4-dihydroxy 2-butanone 4-phosphate synthase/GTP cyclohydrolase II
VFFGIILGAVFLKKNDLSKQFDSVESTVEALKKGEMVILVDSKDREDEGDLVLAAEFANEKNLNFMLSFARGLMCVPVSKKKAKQFSLKKMAENTDRYCTPFTVSVDAKTASTGVSVSDRKKTIQTIASKTTSQNDLVVPGHIFPLIAKDGGVLQRPGHTEGAVDLMKLAGLKETAVIIEIMNKDGSMARLPDLVEFKKKHGLKLLALSSLIDYRLKRESLVEKVASPKLSTEFGDFTAVGFKDKIEGNEYLAMVKGNVFGKKNVLVRVHSGCVTGDIFHSKKCDCQEQLTKSLEMIEKEKLGVLLYIKHHEGRGIGLLNKLRAYELQEKGMDTVEANLALGFKSDQREFGMGAQVLKKLGLSTIRLLTNNPKKLSALEGFGLKISQTIPIKIAPNCYNQKYLLTKKQKWGI